MNDRPKLEIGDLVRVDDNGTQGILVSIKEWPSPWSIAPDENPQIRVAVHEEKLSLVAKRPPRQL